MSEEGSCREKEQICSSRKEGIDKSENKVYFKFHFETELWQKVRSFTLERYSRLKMMGYRRRGIEGLGWIKGEREHKTERKSRGLCICEIPGECSSAPHAFSQRPDPPVGTVNIQLFLVSFTLFGSFPLMCMAQIYIFGWWKSTHNPVWGRGTHEWQANNNNKWTKKLTPNSTSIKSKSNHAPRSSPYSYTAQDVGMTKHLCVTPWEENGLRGLFQTEDTEKGGDRCIILQGDTFHCYKKGTNGWNQEDFRTWRAYNCWWQSIKELLAHKTCSHSSSRVERSSLYVLVKPTSFKDLGQQAPSAPGAANWAY